MTEPYEIIAEIQRRIKAESYRIRSHAVRHMIEEGFDENQLLEALTGKLQLLEDYSEEFRYLALGRFYFATNVVSPLHIVCDLSNEEVLDIVTAYIPQRPWWDTPMQRGEKR